MALDIIIALVVAGILLVLAEIFIPGGIAGTIGSFLILAGIVAGFHRDPTLGFGLLIGALGFGALAFWLWVKYFPRSPMGKRLILQQDGADWHGFDAANSVLLGLVGVAHTSLRPAGTARIGDRRVDVVTRGEMIERGSNVRVIAVEGNRIVVTKAVVEESTADGNPAS
jgi:membrane-bound serine protease (ClpP class)